ncbi:MAG: Ig-like domain-containing protein, partial [Treponemataceae bacterium]
GTGEVTFADATLADTTVIVRGGNVEILAEFEARPTVFYSTPTGTGIYTNTKIYVYFSKAMSKASVESPGAITVMKGGSLPVAGTVELTSSSVARFTPAAYLSPQQYHVIRVAKSVSDSSSASMEADYSGSFRTASTADTEPPTAPAFTINLGTPTHVGSRTITLTEVTAVDGGELVEALIQENGGALQSFAFTPSIDYEITTPADGTKTVRLYAVDSVGNVSIAYAENSVVLDTVAPSGNFSVNNSLNAATEYVNSTSVILASGVTDAGTSMTGAQMQHSVDGGSTWSSWEAYNAAKAATLGSGDGAKIVKLRVKDLVGNTAAFEDTIVYDATPPTFSAFVLNGGASYATSTSLSAALTATDATAGVDQMAFSTDGGSSWGSWKAYAATDTVAASGQGTASISAKVRDRAGNEAILNDGIFVDSVAPTVDTFIADAGATYALAPGVSLTQTATDPNGAQGSGVQNMRFSNNVTSWSDWEAFSASKAWTLASGDGAKTASIQIRDAAGNVGSGSDGIVLDTAAPVISAFYAVATGDGTDYTKNTTVTLMNSVTDAAGTPMEMRFSNDGSTWSGWTAFSGNYSHALSAGDGAKTVYGQFRDAADPTNHVAASTDGIMLDQTGPTVSLTSPANSAAVAGNVPCEANASDASSGVWKVEFFGNGSSVGIDTESPYAAPSPWAVHTLTEASSYPALAVAYDRAGNTTASATNTVTVDNWTAALVTPSTVSTFTGSVTAIAADASFSTLIIAYHNQTAGTVNVVRSTDGGANWSTPYTFGTGSRPDLLMDQNGILHLAYVNGTALTYYRSGNNGTSWTGPTQIASNANSAYAPVIAAMGIYAQIFYMITVDQIGHYYSTNGGGNWTQTTPINGTSITTMDAAGGLQGIHFAYRTNSTQLYHGRYNFGGSADITPRYIASMIASGGLSIAVNPDDPLKAVIPYPSSGGSLYAVNSSNGGSNWSVTSVITSFLNAYPAATLKQGHTGSPLYYIACNNYDLNMLRLFKSSDGVTWFSYDIASTGSATRPSAISDDEYLYIAYYDPTASRLKFAKVKVNF